MSFFGRMGGWNIPNIILSPPPSGTNVDPDEEKKDNKKRKHGCLFWGIGICVMLAIVFILFV